MRRALVLAVALMAFPVLADPPGPGDQPLMQEVPGGYFVNELGMEKLNGELAAFQVKIAKLDTENKSLRTSLQDLEGRPLLTWKAVALLLGGGLVLGGVAGGVAVAVAKR